MEVEDLKLKIKQFGLRPNGLMGQKFLLDEDVAHEMVEIADVKKDERVLEVGPGLGVLTGQLLNKKAKVMAVEKDKRFIAILGKEFQKNHDFSIYNDDILKFDIPKQLGHEFKVVANIPYYLTAKLIQNLLALKSKPSCVVIMVQKEVAERIVAQPGKMSLLALSVQFCADVFIELQVPKELFWPKPEVDSAVIKIIPINKYPTIRDEKLFFRLARAAFAGKRKQLHNTLGSVMPDKKLLEQVFEKSKISPSARPQDLSVEDWVKIYSETEKTF